MLKAMENYFDGTYNDCSLLSYRTWFIDHYAGADTNYDTLKGKLLTYGVTLPNGEHYQLINTNDFAMTMIKDNYQAGVTKLPTTIPEFIKEFNQPDNPFTLEDLGLQKQN